MKFSAIVLIFLLMSCNPKDSSIKINSEYAAFDSVYKYLTYKKNNRVFFTFSSGHLTYVGIDNWEDDFINSDFRPFKELEEFAITSSKLQDLPRFNKEIGIVKVNESNLKSFPDLSEYNQLVLLTIKDVAFMYDTLTIKNLPPSLKRLSLPNNNLKHVNITINSVNNIEDLDLSKNNINKINLEAFKNLKSVNLSGNPIKKEDIKLGNNAEIILGDPEYHDW